MIKINFDQKLNILIILTMLLFGTVIYQTVQLVNSADLLAKIPGAKTKNLSGRPTIPPSRVIRAGLSNPVPPKNETHASWRSTYYGDNLLQRLASNARFDVSGNPACKDALIAYYTERDTLALQALRTIQQQCVK